MVEVSSVSLFAGKKLFISIMEKLRGWLLCGLVSDISTFYKTLNTRKFADVKLGVIDFYFFLVESARFASW